MTKVGKSLLGIAALLNVIVLAAAGLPEPFNWIMLIAAALIAIGIIVEVVGWDLF